MSVIVDTDVVIDYLTGRQQAIELLDRLAPDGLVISIVTFGEIYDGIYLGPDPAAQEQAFDQFLSSAEIVTLDRFTMFHFARIRGDLRRRGMLIPDFDLLIAATALQHDPTLVTRNTGHFARIEGLRLL